MGRPWTQCDGDAGLRNTGSSRVRPCSGFPPRVPRPRLDHSLLVPQGSQQDSLPGPGSVCLCRT